MISSLPIDSAITVSNLSQPRCEVLSRRGAGKGKNGFDISNAVEVVERSCKHFRAIGGTNQKVCLVRIPKKLSGYKFDSVAGGAGGFAFRKELFDATPA
jgi:hypothetical protein